MREKQHHHPESNHHQQFPFSRSGNIFKGIDKQGIALTVCRRHGWKYFRENNKDKKKRKSYSQGGEDSNFSENFKITDQQKKKRTNSREHRQKLG